MMSKICLKWKAMMNLMRIPISITKSRIVNGVKAERMQRRYEDVYFVF